MVGVFILAAVIAIVFFAPRWGQTNVVVYVFICSTLGALTVTGCKGVGVALKQTFTGDQQFTNWLTYVMLGVVIVNILFQLHFLNKALDTFNTAVVTPTYYVMFTSAVTICSLTLFQEFDQMSVDNIIGDLCGFLVIVCGIFLLNVFKDMDISLKNIPNAKKKKESIELNVNGDVRLPVLRPESNLLLQWNENESEDDDSLLEVYDNPVLNADEIVVINDDDDDEKLDSNHVIIKKPKRLFANGHVDHLDIYKEKHAYLLEEVTHF